MRGKVALVTGAAQGIGAEVCRQLAAAGARVVVMDINAAGGEALALEVGGVFVPCNVAEPDSWKQAVQTCIDRVGIPDFAHLNAGVMSVGANDAFLSIEQLPIENYRRIVGVNLDGVVFGLQALLPHMRERGGAITVTASIAGMMGLSIDPTYSATKHAVIGLVRSVAQSLQQSMNQSLKQSAVRVNAICPGGVDTAIVPAALRASDMAMMSTSEIAREVVDLLARGESGEIRVKLGAGVPAYVAAPPALG